MPHTGVYLSHHKDGTEYYRAYVHRKNRRISLGGYDTQGNAVAAVECARRVLDLTEHLSDAFSAPMLYQSSTEFAAISFGKFVSLINLHDNGLYLRVPIYLSRNFFTYYVDIDTTLVFDADDLFFYRDKIIQRRGGRLFVATFDGMQDGLLTRYGVRPFSVVGRDYRFANGNSYDLRLSNIEIINPYYGVRRGVKKGKTVYTAYIHVRGNIKVGDFPTAHEAAVAYNKAVDILMKQGSTKQYRQNYIESLSAREYARIYSELRLPRSLTSPKK
jgi:hypothetical protein